MSRKVSPKDRQHVRPEPLYPLFAEPATLNGIGPRYAKLLSTLAGPHVVDLLWHLPTGLIDRRHAPPIAEAANGQICTLTVTVDAHQPPANRRQPYRITCHDASGGLDLVFFHARGDYLTQMLPPGATRVVSGRVERYHGHPQMAHPDHIVKLEDADEIRRVEAVYPLATGLPPKTLKRAIQGALGRLPATENLPDWSDPALRQREGWATWQEAVRAAHQPTAAADLLPTTAARRRLAYDELLANQLALALVRRAQKKRRGRVLAGDGRLSAGALAAFGFPLTQAQERSLGEIRADMAAPQRMLRLLQGDVGSGKTVVALLAMLTAVETGAQAALMAPTEILARQHLATIGPLAAAIGIEVAVLTGRDKGQARAAARAQVASGAAALVIGTHALFQDGVEFHDLALAVIDEQHRFGVHQRMALGDKGAGVDLLVMTATPIPRSLTMTYYGDLDSSRLDQKPPGRKPVKTTTVAIDRLEDVIAAVGRKMASGEKIFWVCPLVEDSETLDLTAADARAAALTEIFGDRVGLIHGRMKGAEKDAAMDAFRNGGVDLLVATTVIEVGVDVPAATVMVIEHAERFGLAQLHQLRGRIGRGDRAAFCLLLHANGLSQTARARLQVMRDTEDGFKIAEEDLRLRGSGEVLGAKQSGLPAFRLVDMAAHEDLLVIARDEARLLLDRDPELKSDRGARLRALLYLFEREAAIRFLRAG